jgi:hypothetical protein
MKYKVLVEIKPCALTFDTIVIKTLSDWGLTNITYNMACDNERCFAVIGEIILSGRMTPKQAHIKLVRLFNRVVDVSTRWKLIPEQWTEGFITPGG